MIRNDLKIGPWNLTDLSSVQKNGLKVFSCFCCGGGSTMGYKLAGFDVLGGVEIDPEIAALYIQNHKPKHFFQMGVSEFNKIPNEKLPNDLLNLDILDGSPPCSSFSMAGSREKKWGVKKKFREGQAEQVLDDLFFEYLDTVKKLSPKVVVAENVKGLIQGSARGYVKQIFKGFRDAGYTCQLFLLNSAVMGVPQKRERTFFIANRLGKKISLSFNEKLVSIDYNCSNAGAKKLTELQFEYWQKVKPGKSFSSVHPKGSWFTWFKASEYGPQSTLISGTPRFHFREPRTFSNIEYKRLQTFPDDYKCKDAHYICGMSVPPFMMQRISLEIQKQLLG